MGVTLEARILVKSKTDTAVSGTILRLKEPLSLWGGLDPQTGVIIDQRHPNVGECVTDKILVLTQGKGSSSASSILLEAVEQKTAPAAIILAEVDGIIALGATVAREMYANTLPVLLVPQPEFEKLEDGNTAVLFANGRVEINKPSTQ